MKKKKIDRAIPIWMPEMAVFFFTFLLLETMLGEFFALEEWEEGKAEREGQSKKSFQLISNAGSLINSPKSKKSKGIRKGRQQAKPPSRLPPKDLIEGSLPLDLFPETPSPQLPPPSDEDLYAVEIFRHIHPVSPSAWCAPNWKDGKISVHFLLFAFCFLLFAL